MDSQETDRTTKHVKLAQTGLEYLNTIDTPEKAHAFVAQATQVISETFAKHPELSLTKFMRIFGDMVANNARKETADCKREIEIVEAKGQAASIELSARVRAARTAGDQAAEHAVRKEGRMIQASLQAKADATAKRAKVGSLRLDAYKSLASALAPGLPDPIAGNLGPETVHVPSPRTASLRQPSVRSLKELLDELDRFTGLLPVKVAVHQLIDMAQVEQMRKAAGLPVAHVSRHLVFTGNPGTGKTTIARLLARLYMAIGILKTGQLVEVTRSDLVAGYVGQTAIKTTEAIKRALGGILFVDEAYSLARSPGSGQDYGQEAIDTLVKLMEDHRDELVVIVAGYNKEMAEFIRSNPGLPSRLPRIIDFPDYTTDELVLIFRQMCADGKYDISAETLGALGQYLAGLPRTREFGNGRLVRNIFESALARQASRIIATNSSDLTKLTLADIGIQVTEARQLNHNQPQTGPYV